MKKSLKTVLISIYILFILGGSCFADVIMPGQSPDNHGLRRQDIRYEMITKPSVWKYILIGITIIAIVNVVILIIMKKSKQKEEKESDDKTNNN